jgi:prolyl 4-hydroxylase
MTLDEAGNPSQPLPRESRHPAKRVEIVRGFMTPAECEFLVEIAQQRFSPAMINRAGIMVRDPVRTNETASFSFDVEWPFVHAINRRIAAATGTDVGQGEALNLLRYRPGQEYKLHCDAAPGEANQRILTALVYLNQGFGGGETFFPQLGFEFRGAVGDLLIFGNTTGGGDRDVDMIHAGLPVQSGIKLVASRWIRERPPFDATMSGEDAYGGTV